MAEASDIIQAALAIEPDHEKGINVQGDPMMGMLQGFLFAVRGRAAEAASAFMKVPLQM